MYVGGKYPTRAYLCEQTSRPPTASVVADLLRAAADRLDGLGSADVNDVNFTSAVLNDAETSVTIYFDPEVER